MARLHSARRTEITLHYMFTFIARDDLNPMIELTVDTVALLRLSRARTDDGIHDIAVSMLFIQELITREID